MAPVSIETGNGKPPIVLDGHKKEAEIRARETIRFFWDELSKQLFINHGLSGGKQETTELEIGGQIAVPTGTTRNIQNTPLTETVTVTRLPDDFEE